MVDFFDWGKVPLNTEAMLRLLQGSPATGIDPKENVPMQATEVAQARQAYLDDLDDDLNDEDKEAVYKAMLKGLKDQKMFSLLYQAGNIQRGLDKNDKP